MLLFWIVGEQIPEFMADGAVIYCAQDTSGLTNPYDPTPTNGTITYCAQNTSGL